MNEQEKHEKYKKFLNDYGNNLIRKIDLIASADIHNPEAVELWLAVRNCDWIKPEIREKWEKALKGVEIK